MHPAPTAPAAADSTASTPVDAALARTLERFAQLDARTETPGLGYAQRRRVMSTLQAQLIRTPLAGITQQQHFISAPGRGLDGGRPQHPRRFV